MNIYYCGFELVVEVYNVEEPVAAFITGAWENCYPAEDGSFDFEVIEIDYVDCMSDFVDNSETFCSEGLYEAIYEELF